MKIKRNNKCQLFKGYLFTVSHNVSIQYIFTYYAKKMQLLDKQQCHLQ